MSIFDAFILRGTEVSQHHLIHLHTKLDIVCLTSHLYMIIFVSDLNEGHRTKIFEIVSNWRFVNALCVHNLIYRNFSDIDRVQRFLLTSLLDLKYHYFLLNLIIL